MCGTGCLNSVVPLPQVALGALENILKVGQDHPLPTGDNRYALMIEEEGGLETIESLQHAQSEKLYAKAYKIISTYFPDPDDGREEAPGIVPQQNTNQPFLQFNAPAAGGTGPFGFN